jgi:hypothetical protein
MKTRWTIKRLDAAINALNAMLAGEEGEGDWSPDHSADDLESALKRLQEEREQLIKNRKNVQLCPNCSSDRHVNCCARCGKHVSVRDVEFCSTTCSRAQLEADRISDEMERDHADHS